MSLNVLAFCPNVLAFCPNVSALFSGVWKYSISGCSVGANPSTGAPKLVNNWYTIFYYNNKIENIFKNVLIY
jgi:hypothetical protein